MPLAPNHFGDIAQTVERLFCTQDVAGSIPAFSTIYAAPSGTSKAFQAFEMSSILMCRSIRLRRR